MKVMTLAEYRDRLESQIAYFESCARDKEERVFNGWTTYRQVSDEIRFWRERARVCRYLLMMG